MNKKEYQPEQYWSTVGQRIKSRENGKNIIAGDDEPYYRYKRSKFIEILKTVDFKNKSVLEVGCGPGGNLIEVLKSNPAKLVGVDISNEMVSLAKDKVPQEVEIIKIDGSALPFEDKSFEIVFTATVLQHNTDTEMLKVLMKEIARVSSDKVFLFERIESEIKGNELCEGRPISFYSSIMDKFGFEFVSSKFLNVRVSYFISGIIRKVFNPGKREEGEALTPFSESLQNLSLPLTKVLDKMYTPPKDVAKLEYRRRI